jgi:hypothetical protein
MLQNFFTVIIHECLYLNCPWQSFPWQKLTIEWSTASLGYALTLLTYIQPGQACQGQTL